MLRNRRGLAFVLCSTQFLLGGAAFAPTPPEANALREAKPGQSQVDPRFEEWINGLYDAKSGLQLSDSEFQDASSKMEASTRLYLQLRRGAKGDSPRELLKQALAQYQAPQSTLAQEPLAPYLAFGLLDLAGLEPKDKQFLRDFIYEKGGQSCPRKKLILQDLKTFDKGSIKTEQAQQLLTWIQQFRSMSFQEDALRALLSNMSPQALKELQAPLQLAVSPYPRLVGDFAGVLEDTAPNNRPVVGALLKAEKLASDDRCEEAQAKLLAAVTEDKDKKFIPSVDSTVGKIELCFKVKGDKHRLTYFQAIGEPLKTAYGFLGETMSTRRQALIYWGRNEFEEARALFSKLVQDSEKEYPDVHAEALFTYARIFENEGKFPEAIEQYEAFTARYPKNDQLNQALSSLIILYSLQKDSDKALSYALKLVELDAVKEMDLRDPGSASMALYWAGKIYFERKEKKRAEFYWSRLAQEHYSTFYGALGHYALEKLTHRKYLLPPTQTPDFDRENLFREFQGEDRKLALRIERLLSQGLKEEAACEIREIPILARENQKQLVKSIFQFAAGDWLGAVRIYQNLPKSFRMNLPRGVEKVLFPRAYDELVSTYAKKMDLDPQYINAIIRQESVFNPKAQSAVGARGLMQLMPGTARLELAAMRGDYVPADKHEKMNRLRTDESQLSDPEVNVAVGVQHVHKLFLKYKHPVFVLTSYNANPRATERWMEKIDSSDMILFIERIPYRETRSYVKLVMRNYFYYKRWYEGPTAPVPLFETLLPKSLTQQVVAVEKEPDPDSSKAN